VAERAVPVSRWIARKAVERASGLTDRDLLLRFAGGDEAAFAVVVNRHGRLVYATCRRLLATQEDAEDACQATFLVLARKAGAVRWQSSVANWLYATARRVAMKARRAATRRAGREAAAATPEAAPPLDAVTGRELLAALDEELGRLPARYREPLVLCYLDGLSRDEAASCLGLPPATVKTRLERGRKRLAAALLGRGVAPGVCLLALAATADGIVITPGLTDAILAVVRGSPPPTVAALAVEVTMYAAVGRVSVVAVVSAALLGVMWGVAGAGDEFSAGTPSAAPLPVPAVRAAVAPRATEQKVHTGVAEARRKAVKFLTDRQTPEGNWEAVQTVYAGMEGGETALVTLALLEAGVPPAEPALKKAVRYVAEIPPKKTYVVGLQTRVLARADPKAHAARIQANADWLVAQGIGLDRGRLEGWSYPAGQHADQSNTHFAVFGLHAAKVAGAKVEARVWPAVRDHYVRTRRDGGWTYHPASDSDTAPTYSMTAAAVAGLAVADRHSGPTARGREAAEKGMRALVTAPPAAPKSIGYKWMVTAELGRAIGAKSFRSGDVEVRWYQEGAEKLVADQRPDGSWVPGRGVDGLPVTATAFGLYFLGSPQNE